MWAQAISTSQIKGTVLDPSGSVVPGAEVSVTQTDTGIARTATTGAGPHAGDASGQQVAKRIPIALRDMAVPAGASATARPTS